MSDYNNVFREATIAGLALIPEVGGFLALFATLVWKEDDPIPKLTAQMETLMSQLAQQIETDGWVTTLRGKLHDLASDLWRIKQEAPPILQSDGTWTVTTLWQTAMQALLTDSHNAYDYFVNPDAIEKTIDGNTAPAQYTVAYLVAYGTIHLSALREQAVHYKYIWGRDYVDDPNDIIRTHLGQLTAKLATDRQATIDWRRSQIKIDVFDGPVLENVNSIRHERSDTVSDAQNSHALREFDFDPARAHQHYWNLHWDIGPGNGGFISNLDNLLDAARFWPYMDPTNNPSGVIAPSPGLRFWCDRWGNGFRPGSYFNHRDLYNQHGKLSRLDIWWDGGALKGLQAYYGGQPSPMHGSQAELAASCNVGAGDAVISVRGAYGDWIDRFAFSTAFLGGHQKIDGFDFPDILGNYQAGDTSMGFGGTVPLSDSSPQLAYFGGWTDGGVIGQLQFVWSTGEQYTTGLPQEHTAQALQDPQPLP